MLFTLIVAAPLCAAVAVSEPEIDEVTGLGAFRGELSDRVLSPFLPVGTIGLESAARLEPAPTLTRASSLIQSWGEGRIVIELDVALSAERGEALEVVALVDAWAALAAREPAASAAASRFFVSISGASSDGLERAVMGFVANETGPGGSAQRGGAAIPAPGGLAAALAALLTLRRRRAA